MLDNLKIQRIGQLPETNSLKIFCVVNLSGDMLLSARSSSLSITRSRKCKFPIPKFRVLIDDNNLSEERTVRKSKFR